MNRSFAAILITLLAVSVGPQAVPSAQIRHHDAGIDIVVNGVPQKHYEHNGRWYVEALKGREYAIRLRNPYPVRVAVALSVDGLNTIDARHTAAADARKWVIGPHETITISGWQVNSAEARRFEFTTEAQSYGRALGQTANLGLISAVFFRERVAVTSRDSFGSSATPKAKPAPAAPQGAAESASADSAARRSDADGYAATGMGRRTDHAVTQVSLDLERTPAKIVNIRYEFRPQLIRLGVLLATPIADPLPRRERARGFESGFSPEVP